MIHEVDANGNDLNPTIIKWGEPESFTPANASTYSSLNNISGTTIGGLKAGDVDGDGFSDLIGLVLGNNNGFYPMINDLRGKIVVNSSQNSPSFLPWQSTSQMNLPDINPVETVTACMGMFSFDEDDDNKEEVFSITYAQNGSVATVNQKKYYIHKLKSDPNGNLAVTKDYEGVQANNLDFAIYNSFTDFPGNPFPFFIDKNDFSGDGLFDMLVCDQEMVRLYTNQTVYTYPSGKLTMVKTGDIDGDGKLDIYLFTKNGNSYSVKVLTFSPGNNSLQVKSSLNFSTIFIEDYCLKRFDVGDLNGDGKSDIFYYDDDIFSFLHVCYSNGISIMPAVDLEIFGNNGISFAVQDKKAVFLRDINHDNKTDIILKSIYYNTTGLTKYSVLYSIGGNKFYTASQFIQNEKFILAAGGDFNGDGNEDFFSATGQNQAETINYKPFKDQRTHFVSRIENANRPLQVYFDNLGGGIDVNNNMFYYTSSPSNVPSGIKIIRPSMTVATLVKFLGRSYFYSYENGLLHRGGRGFLGFEKFKKVVDGDLLGSVTIEKTKMILFKIKKSILCNFLFFLNVINV